MINLNFIISIIIFNFLIFIFFNKISKLIGLYDIPDNKRKIHKIKVPCIGGVLLIINLIYLLILNYFYNLNYIFQIYFENKLASLIIFFLCLSFFFVVGLYDDNFSINPNVKLVLFCLIFIFLVVSDENLQLKTIRISFLSDNYDIPNISIFFTVLCFLVFMNAFNMYDGINLQSSSFSIVIFFYLFFISGFKDHLSFIIIVFFIFFSILNIKNKLFLGDNGSLVVSFLISYSLIKYYNKGVILNADEVFLVLFLPVMDLLRIFFMRLTKGGHPFKPDNIHLHHLILKKSSYKFTILLVFMIYFIPVSLGLIFKNFHFFLIIQTLIYILILTKYMKYSYVKKI